MEELYSLRKKLNATDKELTEALEILIDDVKGCNQTDQSIDYNHSKTINYILSENEDIDNNDVYDISTGQTIREL